LAAPRAEFVEPFRRVPAINGGEAGVEITASSAFNPFTPGVAAPAALLGVAVGLAHGVVDVEEHQLVGARNSAHGR
jgi:hypothetical protein